MIITLQHDFSHHGFVEYNWNGDQWVLGEETNLFEHESLDSMHLNREGDLLSAHISRLTTTTTKGLWFATETWKRYSSTKRWIRQQQLFNVSPPPSVLSIATCENGDFHAVTGAQHANTYIFRKQHESGWYIQGGQDPDFVTSSPLGNGGMDISFSSQSKSVTLWILVDHRVLKLFQWNF